MQQAMVLIATALVLAVCAKGLPEGKDCVLKRNVFQMSNFFKLLSALLKLLAVLTFCLLCIHYAGRKVLYSN